MVGLSPPAPGLQPYYPELPSLALGVPPAYSRIASEFLTRRENGWRAAI